MLSLASTVNSVVLRGQAEDLGGDVRVQEPS
jgi:hypothetical protein